MCMWQSHALAGALSLGASVPDEYGTCWASLLRKLSRLLSSETLCWPWPLPQRSDLSICWAANLNRGPSVQFAELGREYGG